MTVAPPELGVLAPPGLVQGFTLAHHRRPAGAATSL